MFGPIMHVTDIQIFCSSHMKEAIFWPEIENRLKGPKLEIFGSRVF
jgi:hypothetical protein